MSNTTLIRKFRTAGVAAAVFIIGAGIGWQFADILFREGHPTPMIASIRFEGAQPAEPIDREAGHASIHGPVSYRSVEEEIARHSDAAQRVADAVRTVNQWQDQMHRLAIAEALGWSEVAEQSRRFGQGQDDVQKVIRAQIEREQKEKRGQRMAFATNAVIADVTSGPVVVRASSHAKQCGSACVASKRATKRTVHGPRAGSRADGVMCPWQWLEAMVLEAFAEHRDRRQYRS